MCTGRTLSHPQGAKEEAVAFERVMLRGPEAMGTALVLLGEMGMGDSTNKTAEREGGRMWKGVGSVGDGGPKQNPRRRAPVDRGGRKN